MLNSIEEAISQIRSGGVVIVVDDEDRENEGDFICAAEVITPDIVNFMATYGRGLICTPITEQRADELNLWPMVPNNTSMHETAFTVSIDYLKEGCTTGISAYDRATGIKALTYADTAPEDYARPGHIFPLRAKEGGVLRRVGHTEAAIDLARLAGFYPAGVLVEILNEDGTLARLTQLKELSVKYNMPIVSIKDLVSYRLENEKLVREIYARRVELPDFGEVKIHVFEQLTTGDQHIAITKGSWRESDSVPVRVQTSNGLDNIERFFNKKSDQSIYSILSKINEIGFGALIIMRHEEKMKEVVSTIEDLLPSTGEKEKRLDAINVRDIGIGSQIVRALNIRKISLLTNSSYSSSALEGYGIKITENLTY